MGGCFSQPWDHGIQQHRLPCLSAESWFLGERRLMNDLDKLGHDQRYHTVTWGDRPHWLQAQRNEDGTHRSAGQLYNEHQLTPANSSLLVIDLCAIYAMIDQKHHKNTKTHTVSYSMLQYKRQ